MDPLAAALIAVEENADKLKGAPGKAGDPGLEWRGPWAPGDTYAPGDAVELDGSSYVAVLPSKNQRPPSGAWDLLAQKGAPGAPGRRGGGGGNSGGAGVSDHGALTGLADNDHPQYTTDAEATTLADASVATHAGAADPHTGYRLESADHSHATTGLQGGTLAGYVQNPLTEDLDAGEQEIVSAASGSVGGAALRVVAATVDDGGYFEMIGGAHPVGGNGAFATLSGANADGGGGFDFAGGSGAEDKAGGAATLRGGQGHDGGNPGAQFTADGGDETVNPGRARITTDNSTGDAGEVLTAQGDGTALWVAGVSNPMTADLDAGGFGIKGTDDGSNLGARLEVQPAGATFGGSVLFNAGDDATGNVGAAISAFGAEDGGGGGGFDLIGGTGLGTAGNPGGTVNLQGGGAAAANSAKIRLEGGADDGTTHGRIRITTDDVTGDSGHVLTAQGDGTALWAAASGGLTQPQVMARSLGC